MIRLGRNAAELMTTIRDLGERGIVLRSLHEGIDTSNATVRMAAAVPASPCYPLDPHGAIDDDGRLS